MIKKTIFFRMVIMTLYVFLPSKAIAGDWINWHASNAQILRGYDYKIGKRQRTIVTLEHANDWKYGDNFAFVDITFPDGPDTTYYGEIAPRLSLGKLSGYDFSYGIIKDVLFSTMLEKPEHQGPRYLYGSAIDLDLPGFTFFKTNFFVRDDTQLEGDTWQMTLAWQRPFQINDLRFVTEGFADFAGGEGPGKSPNEFIVPRLLLDVGNLAGYQDNKLWLGIEYSYWYNKFGIEGVTESTPQLQFKVIF